MKKNKILVIHGPNLHLLGKRETGIYGKISLKQIDDELKQTAEKYDFLITTVQTNSEAEIVDLVTETAYDFLIINPAAYTHTSVAIRDALLAVNKPTIEVHLSNIYKREEFRKKSLVSDVVMGVISGLGKCGYMLALKAAYCWLNAKKS
jgi:3-dehydroquinate dehydratase-2